VAYEEFLDPGLAFSDKEIEAWDALAWATTRVEYLIGLHQELQVLRDISEKPKWIEVTHRKIRYCVGQYVRIGVANPLKEEDELDVWYPTMTPAVRRKALAAIEHRELEDWIAVWVQDVRNSLSYVVSIGHHKYARDRHGRRVNNQVAGVLYGQELTNAEARQKSLANQIARLEELNGDW